MPCGVEAVKGWPLKKVAWISLGVSFPAAMAVATTETAATPASTARMSDPPRIGCCGDDRASARKTPTGFRKVLRNAPAAQPLLGAGVASGGICSASGGAARSSGGGGRICTIRATRARRSFASLGRARADAELDAVALAVAILADALVIDAASSLDRIARFAPADVPVVRFPVHAFNENIRMNRQDCLSIHPDVLVKGTD